MPRTKQTARKSTSGMPRVAMRQTASKSTSGYARKMTAGSSERRVAQKKTPLQSTHARIESELKEINDLSDSFLIDKLDHVFSEFRVEIYVPENLVMYDGLTLFLEIKLTNSFPFRPPLVEFISKINHPKVNYQTGLVDVDILSDKYTSETRLLEILQAIKSLVTVEPIKKEDIVVLD